MKRNYLQPSSIVEAIETANLLDTIPPSPGYGEVQFAPSKLYKK
jgi:hypothetical protein